MHHGRRSDESGCGEKEKLSSVCSVLVLFSCVDWVWCCKGTTENTKSWRTFVTRTYGIAKERREMRRRGSGRAGENGVSVAQLEVPYNGQAGGRGGTSLLGASIKRS